MKDRTIRGRDVPELFMVEEVVSKLTAPLPEAWDAITRTEIMRFYDVPFGLFHAPVLMNKDECLIERTLVRDPVAMQQYDSARRAPALSMAYGLGIAGEAPSLFVLRTTPEHMTANSKGSVDKQHKQTEKFLASIGNLAEIYDGVGLLFTTSSPSMNVLVKAYNAIDSSVDDVSINFNMASERLAKLSSSSDHPVLYANSTALVMTLVTYKKSGLLKVNRLDDLIDTTRPPHPAPVQGKQPQEP